MTQDKLERIVLANARLTIAFVTGGPYDINVLADELKREMWAYLPDAPDPTTVAGSQAAAKEREVQRAIDTINRFNKEN